MKISRRKFIEAAPIVATAVLGAKNVAFGQKAPRESELTQLTTDQLSLLTWDSFLPYQGTKFVFRDRDGEEITLVLTEMDNSSIVSTKGSPAAGECFTLRFTGPSKPIFSQNTYEVRHFALGDFSLFITDGGRARRSNFYQAVFNRITV